MEDGGSFVAAAALGRIGAGDRRAVDALARSLLDPWGGDIEIDHALAAVDALEAVGPSVPEALGVLEAVERDNVRLREWQAARAGTVRDAARDALRRVRAR